MDPLTLSLSLMLASMSLGAIAGVLLTSFRKPRRSKINLSHLSKFFTI